MKDMLDRSLSPKQKGSVSGRLIAFIVAGWAIFAFGGFALGVRGVNKRITQHRADVPTAPEKLRVQKVADVSERGLVEVLAGGRMKNGEAVSIKGRLFPFNDPKTGDAAFLPLSAYDADNNSMEVAQSEDQNEWGVDSRLTQDEKGDLTILEQTDSYISATRKTVETKKGVRSTRYFMIGDHVVYSWDEEAVYSPDDIKTMKARMQGLTGPLAQTANRASFDAKYPDNESRRMWLEKQMADEVIPTAL